MKSANKTTTTFVFNAGSHVFSISAIPPHPFADCSLLVRVKNVSHTATFSSSLMFIFTVSVCCSLACVRDKVHVRETGWFRMEIYEYMRLCISMRKLVCLQKRGVWEFHRREAKWGGNKRWRSSPLQSLTSSFVYNYLHYPRTRTDICHRQHDAWISDGDECAWSLFI